MSARCARNWGALQHLVDLEHCVYEFWVGETCIYVGLTSSLRRRIRDHERAHGWDRIVTHMVVTRFSGRAEAERFEERRIAELLPANNKRVFRSAA